MFTFLISKCKEGVFALSCTCKGKCEPNAARGWRLSKKWKKNNNNFLHLWLVQATPWADFAVVCVSTLFNYDCNLFLCGTFLQRLLPLPDNHGLLQNPKETYDLNSSAVILRISSFRILTIFCTKELYNYGLLTSPRCGCPVPTSDDFCGQTCFVIRSRYSAAAFFLQVSGKCTDLNLIFHYILTLAPRPSCTS